MSRPLRRPARIGILVTLLLAWVFAADVATATAAAAHTRLESTEPSDGARLEQAPAAISLTFAETVLVPRAGLRVLDSEGEHVESGAPFHPGDEGSRVSVRLRPALPDGSYLVRYGILAGDGHPISGAFTFVVGPGPLIGVNGIPAGDTEPDRSVALLYRLGRWLSLCGLAVLGGLIFIATCWRSGANNPLARRLLRVGWSSAVAGTLLSLFLLGPYASEQGLIDALTPGSLAETISLPVGKVLVLRLGALLVLVPVALRLLAAIANSADPVRRNAESLAMAVSLPLLLGYTGAGHAESGTQPTAVVLSDLLHVGAMTVWLGGVVMLAAVAIREARTEELSAAAVTFSRTAFAAVCVLVATGSFQTWQQVGSVRLLWETEYGRILLLKLGAVSLVLLAGHRSRRLVRRRRPSIRRLEPVASGSPVPVATDPTPRGVASDLDRRGLRNAIWAEMVLSGVILGLSATLVAVAPARLEIASPERLPTRVDGQDFAA